MNIIDLSHVIKQDMPVYPGTISPLLKRNVTIENDGFREIELNIVTHTGTHIDVPAHMLKNGAFLNDFSVSDFMGKSYCIDVSSFSGKLIPQEYIEKFSEAIDEIDFLLFHTAWDKYWNNESYFMNFPVLSIEACEYLCTKKLKGIGIDTISVDYLDSIFPNHNILFKSNTILIENLTELSKLIGEFYTFYCMPLKIENGDGSPIRAFAVIEGDKH